ncbi:permease [Sandaracinus amylolyticus]|nr:permease [Sandaracinus amylolyticus]
MSLVVFVSIVSCAIGALIASLARHRPALDAPVRTFAIGAGLALVGTHLVPESARGIGAWSLLLMGASLAVPWLVRERRSAVLATELTYAGLLGYHVFEAARMAIAARSAPESELALALIAHAMPTAALLLVSTSDAIGLRAAGLAIASVLGVSFARFGGEQVASLTPAFDAIASGLLLFVIARALAPVHARTSGRRVSELIALAVGVIVTLLGTRAHWELAPDATRALELRLVDALVDTTLEAAPMLLLGLALGALVQAIGGRFPDRWMRETSPLRDAMRGAVYGAPLPVCACGILPVAEGLAMRRASAALVVAFLLATPQAGVEVFAVMARFLGVPFATAHLVVSLATSIVAAIVIARVARRPAAITIRGRSFELVATSSCSHDDCCDHDHDHAPQEGTLLTRWRAAFDELALHNAPWALVGIVLAALVAELVPAESVAGFAAIGADIPLMAVLAIPAYVCPASAAPLGAVLIAKGLSPGAVLVAVTLGPATNVATLAFLRRRYGTRAAVHGVVALVATAWAGALLVNALVPVALPPLATGEAHEHGWLASASGLALALVVVRALWIAGPAAVLPGLAPASRPFGQDRRDPRNLPETRRAR